jgi:precorrin-4 methylase
MTIAETIAAQAAELEKQRDSATERINTLAAEHASAIAAKDSELATIRSQFAELSAYKDAMVARVSAVLQSGDPAQYEALARDFLTPAEEKVRQEKLAQLEALKAQAAALEAELAK